MKASKPFPIKMVLAIGSSKDLTNFYKWLSPLIPLVISSKFLAEGAMEERGFTIILRCHLAALRFPYDQEKFAIAKCI